MAAEFGEPQPFFLCATAVLGKKKKSWIKMFWVVFLGNCFWKFCWS